MTNTILQHECKSVSEFYKRFSATPEQIASYTPLILSIEYSYSGEQASSYGIFINNKNNCLYKVYGTECSVWDFNGQFTPELLSYNDFENQHYFLLTEENKKNISTKISDLNLDKEKIITLTNEYFQYVESKEITNKYLDILSSIDKLAFTNLFAAHLINIEENISFYKFEPSYEFSQNFYISIDKNIKLYTNINENIYTHKFLNDILGSLEIQENIFLKPVSQKIKLN